MNKILFISSLLAFSGLATAHDSDINLTECSIQETIPGAKATGAFLNIKKTTDKSISLVSAKAPEVTSHVELHEMRMKDGVMSMQQIEEHPLVKGDNILKKGGHHIMLMDLDKTLEVGEKYPLTLIFSDGITVSCDAEVKSVESLTPKGMKMHNHKDMKHK